MDIFDWIIVIWTYGLVGVVVYAISVHAINTWFESTYGIREQFKDWQKAYNRRIHTDKNSSMYPSFRRDERWEAVHFMKKLSAGMIFPFWPIVLLVMLVIGAFKAFKGVGSVLSNSFKIFDSIKGE